MADLQKLHDAILNGDAKTSAAVALQALEEQVPPIELIQKAMVPAMDEVGRRFECQDYFVPELLLSARAMKAALDPLRPSLAASGAQPAGKVIVGTVKGDLHDIGKNLVAVLLEGGGYQVIDLGVNVAPEQFVETARATGANIICLSALLTVTMVAMKSTIEALHAAGMRERVKVLIGGAPVTQRFAQEIGADGYGDNASTAVSLARSFTTAAGVV